MENIAIVVVAYNRANSLARLLDMIQKAHYSIVVDLIISIDFGENQDVIDVAHSLEWKHGNKKIIQHQKNLGLKKHIISCGDIVKNYDAIVMLEDDLLVSKYYFDFAYDALQFYNNDENIAGIGLYHYPLTESSLSKFQPLTEHNEVYFIQLPCSWGQVWTQKQWRRFKSFYEQWNGTFKNIPTYIQYWGMHSWKKIFAEYMIQENQFFVHPVFSFTSNPGEQGTNYHSKINYYETKLSERKIQLGHFNNAYHYDTNFELLPFFIEMQSPVLQEYNFAMDLHGSKTPEEIKNPYVLTTQKCRKPILSFSNELFPLERNIIENKKGSKIHLCKTNDMIFGYLFRWQNKLRPYYYTRNKLRNKLKLYFNKKIN